MFLDRASGAAIVPAIVDLFVDLLHRTMLSIPMTIASVCLAQHACLADDGRSLARLCAALRTLGSVGEAHAPIEAAAFALGNPDDPALAHSRRCIHQAKRKLVRPHGQ